MFHFFHKTPEINLDCFTSDNCVYTHTPIVRASKAFPDWWKTLDRHEPHFEHTPENPFHLVEEKNARDCYAIIELYKRGVIIENWCDISFRTENGGFNYWYSSGLPPQAHEKKQINYAFPNHHQIKLVSPWVFRETTGVKFLWLGAEWSLDKLEIKVLPGVINFDIISDINVNLMFPVRDGIFTINAGLPLVHLVPLSDKNLKVTNHIVTEQELNKIRINSSLTSFFGWRKALQLRKRNRERGTCPFHGDKNG
jgi:hypothetical protein